MSTGPNNRRNHFIVFVLTVITLLLISSLGILFSKSVHLPQAHDYISGDVKPVAPKSNDSLSKSLTASLTRIFKKRQGPTDNVDKTFISTDNNSSLSTEFKLKEFKVAHDETKGTFKLIYGDKSRYFDGIYGYTLGTSLLVINNLKYLDIWKLTDPNLWVEQNFNTGFNVKVPKTMPLDWAIYEGKEGFETVLVIEKIQSFTNEHQIVFKEGGVVTYLYWGLFPFPPNVDKAELELDRAIFSAHGHLINLYMMDGTCYEFRILIKDSHSKIEFVKKIDISIKRSTTSASDTTTTPPINSTLESIPNSPTSRNSSNRRILEDGVIIEDVLSEDSDSDSYTN